MTKGEFVSSAFCLRWTYQRVDSWWGFGSITSPSSPWPPVTHSRINSLHSYVCSKDELSTLPTHGRQPRLPVTFHKPKWQLTMASACPLWDWRERFPWWAKPMASRNSNGSFTAVLSQGHSLSPSALKIFGAISHITVKNRHQWSAL